MLSLIYFMKRSFQDWTMDGGESWRDIEGGAIMAIEMRRRNQNERQFGQVHLVKERENKNSIRLIILWAIFLIFRL